MVKLVGESVNEAFKKFNIKKDRQYHKCIKCGLIAKYESVEYISGYVVFTGKPHGCEEKFWGARAIPISEKEIKYWNNII